MEKDCLNGQSRRAFFAKAGFGAGVLALAPLASQVAKASETRGLDVASNYDFDVPYNRLGTDCVKWDEEQRDLDMDHIVAGMGIADMDFRCVSAVTDALRKRIHHENWGYVDMDSPGTKAFVQSIVDWNEKHYGIKVMNHDNAGIATGVDGGIKIALRVRRAS